MDKIVLSSICSRKKNVRVFFIAKTISIEYEKNKSLALKHYSKEPARQAIFYSICIRFNFKKVFLEGVIFMSRCQKCQNVKTLKTELKANGEIFSKTDTCAKLRKFCATCAKLFKKSSIFLLPLVYTVHGNNLGKIFRK